MDRFNISGNTPEPLEELGDGLRWVIFLASLAMAIVLALSGAR